MEGDPEPAGEGESAGRQVRLTGGQFDEGQRIPGGLGEQPSAGRAGEGRARTVVEQADRVRFGQAGEPQLGQAGQRSGRRTRPGRAVDPGAGRPRVGRHPDTRARARAIGGRPADVRPGPRVTGGEQQRDALGPEPARRDQQGVQRGAVEPLQIVDHAQQRLLGGEFGEQPERGQPREQSVGAAGRLAEPERALQRTPLRSRQGVQPVQAGRQQQAQPGEGEFGLVLDAGRPDHPEPVTGRRHRVLQHGRLADPRLAAQQQDPAATPARPVEQRVDGGPLPFPPVQHPGPLPRRPRALRLRPYWRPPRSPLPIRD